MSKHRVGVHRLDVVSYTTTTKQYNYKNDSIILMYVYNVLNITRTRVYKYVLMYDQRLSQVDDSQMTFTSLKTLSSSR